MKNEESHRRVRRGVGGRGGLSESGGLSGSMEAHWSVRGGGVGRAWRAVRERGPERMKEGGPGRVRGEQRGDPAGVAARMRGTAGGRRAAATYGGRQ